MDICLTSVVDFYPIQAKYSSSSVFYQKDSQCLQLTLPFSEGPLFLHRRMCRICYRCYRIFGVYIYIFYTVYLYCVPLSKLSFFLSCMSPRVHLVQLPNQGRLSYTSHLCLSDQCLSVFLTVQISCQVKQQLYHFWFMSVLSLVM